MAAWCAGAGICIRQSRFGATLLGSGTRGQLDYTGNRRSRRAIGDAQVPVQRVTRLGEHCRSLSRGAGQVAVSGKRRQHGRSAFPARTRPSKKRKNLANRRLYAAAQQSRKDAAMSTSRTLKKIVAGALLSGVAVTGMGLTVGTAQAQPRSLPPDTWPSAGRRSSTARRIRAIQMLPGR